MNYSKNKVIVIMLLIILLLSPVTIYYDGTKEEVVIGYLTESYEDRETLNKMKFDVVFGAPHYSGYKSYKYYNNEFVQSGNYVSNGVNGQENVDKLNWIISEYKNINSYKDIKKIYGQIRLIKTVDEYEFFIFDEELKSTDKSGYQLNTIFKRNNTDYTYEKLEVETPSNFCIKDITYYKDVIYLVGTNTTIVNNETTTKMVSYKIEGEKVERLVLHKIYGYYNEKSICIADDTLYFGYYDKSNQEILMSVNLDNDNIVKHAQIGKNTSRKIYEDYKIKNMLYYDDTLYVFCKGDISMGESNFYVIEFDKYLNLKDYYSVEIESYDDFNKAFVFENEIYIAIKQSSIHGAIYRFDNKEINKLIMFGLNTQKNELFYYDLFVND